MPGALGRTCDEYSRRTALRATAVTREKRLDIMDANRRAAVKAVEAGGDGDRR
jgi:hypothetical protein